MKADNTYGPDLIEGFLFRFCHKPCLISGIIGAPFILDQLLNHAGLTRGSEDSIRISFGLSLMVRLTSFFGTEPAEHKKDNEAFASTSTPIVSYESS